jgi:hypothetical protein
MRIIFVILLFFLLLTNLLAQDSTTTDSIISKIHFGYSQIDSITYVKILNEDSFGITYQGLFGALFGSLLAAIIAIYSIKKTHKNQIFLENEKIHNRRHIEEKIYSGFLFSIYSILLNHKEISKALKRELDVFAENVKETGDLLIEKPYNRYSIDLLKECLLKSLSYENYESDTIMYLVTYVNKLENFESNLNFVPLLKVRDQHKSSAEYAETVKLYFADLLKLIVILDSLNDTITKLIFNYLLSSEVVNMKEHLEALHNRPLKSDQPNGLG